VPVHRVVDVSQAGAPRRQRRVGEDRVPARLRGVAPLPDARAGGGPSRGGAGGGHAADPLAERTRPRRRGRARGPTGGPFLG